MINAVPGVDEGRRQRLIKVLDIDPNWRMHQLSDGQRRRVQICVGLLRPFKVRGAERQGRAVFRRGVGRGCSPENSAPLLRPCKVGGQGVAVLK
jgi:hypothetical protein